MFRNCLLLLTSCAACLFAGEAVSRIVFDPIDVLKVSLEEDPILSYKIPANESGHDALGFRNKKVPKKVDILAIGDSMTYGNMASSGQSWPAHYANLTGASVYNAGIGGYGPAHYLHNLKTLAPQLSPDTVIMTLYVGNDFLDTYNLVYGIDHWARYRDPSNTDRVEAEPLVIPAGDRAFGKTRDWLSHNSVIYRLATQSPVFDKARLQERQALSSLAYVISHNEKTHLLSQKAAEYVNFDDPKIHEGFEISKRILQDAKLYCDERNIAFRVAIMPMKEHVFVEALPELFTQEQQAELAPFIGDLDALHTGLGRFLETHNMRYVDLKPDLVAAVRTSNIYPATDGHPNSAGYAVSAASMFKAFDHGQTKSAQNKLK